LISNAEEEKRKKKEKKSNKHANKILTPRVKPWSKEFTVNTVEYEFGPAYCPLSLVKVKNEG